MKRCSECGRTYSDESLIYCLDDGTLLSAGYDLPPTQLNSTPRSASLKPTEVLSSRSSRPGPPPQGKPLLPYLLVGLAVLIVVVVALAVLLWAAVSSMTSVGTPAKTASADPIAQIDISGHWVDNFGNTSQISQQGNQIQLTSSGTACNGRFQSSGSGTINGNRLDIVYRANYSYGRCQGTVSADGMQITSTCLDSVCGQWQLISYRVRE